MRILVQHLAQVAKTLREYAVQCGIIDHGGTVGQAREALASHFLQSHLADSVNYLTGEVFDRHDARSGQIDVLIYPRSAPRLNLFGQINALFADWALAAIEVKSTLTTADIAKPSHLRSALDSCVRLKRLAIQPRYGLLCADGTRLPITRIPYMVFAFDGPTEETLRSKLWEFSKTESIEPDLLPDIITVLNRGYYIVRNNGWLIPIVDDEKVIYSKSEEPEGVLLGMFAYLTNIIEAASLAPSTTPFRHYLRLLRT